jgi:glycosyltransferase involved in cell wall biosynthesis
MCLDRPDVKWLSDYDFPVVALGESEGKYGFSSKAVPWLKSNVSLFDAVIVHGIWQFHSLATYLACRCLKTPYYVFIHGALDPWFKRHYFLKHLKKCIYWLLVEYHVLKRSGGLLFTSKDEKLLARESFWPYNFNELVVGFGKEGRVANTLFEKAQFLKKFPNLTDRKLILFVSRMHAKKGVDLLVKAFFAIAKAHPEYQLVMLGPDPDDFQSKLETNVTEELARRVTWTGWVDSDEKWGAYALAEVFALVSHSENWGAAVVEALLSGTPVLLSNKVNIWREVVDSEAGLVDDDTEDGAARLMVEWISLDIETKNRYATQSRKCFEQNFDHKTASRRLLESII